MPGTWLQLLAGLRKGELKALKWADVNFQDQTLTVREGKAKRIDVALNAQAAFCRAHESLAGTPATTNCERVPYSSDGHHTQEGLQTGRHCLGG